MFCIFLLSPQIEGIINIRMSELSIDQIVALISTFIGLLIIFLGLDSDITEKKSKLRFVLFSYLPIAGLLVLDAPTGWLFLVGIILYILGGLSYMSQDGLKLERELNAVEMLLYCATATFCLTSQQFLFLLIAIIAVCRVFCYELIISFQLWLTGIFCLINYIYVNKDFFCFRNFNESLKEWKAPDKSMDNVSGEDSQNKISKSKIDFLSLFICFEDRDYLERKSSNYFSWTLLKRIFRRIIYRKSYPPIKTRIHRVKLIRGYSTIEQQFIRVHALYDYSYRCKFRRKFFIEMIYTPLILKSIRKRRARFLSKGYRNRVKKARSLIIDLKYALLKSYFQNILKSPANQTELVSRLSRQTGLSKDSVAARLEKAKTREIFETTEYTLVQLDSNPEQFNKYF